MVLRIVLRQILGYFRKHGTSVKLRMVSFWMKLVQSENKPSSILYRLVLQIHQSGNHDFKWISFVMSIFGNTGLTEFYSIFKFEFELEIYFSKLSVKNRINLSKYTCSNMKLPIETGR